MAATPMAVCGLLWPVPVLSAQVDAADARELVCQVRFGEWTRDGKLRHPVFLGLREDKEAREVVRE